MILLSFFVTSRRTIIRRGVDLLLLNTFIQSFYFMWNDNKITCLIEIFMKKFFFSFFGYGLDIDFFKVVNEPRTLVSGVLLCLCWAGESQIGCGEFSKSGRRILNSIGAMAVNIYIHLGRRIENLDWRIKDFFLS